MLLLRNIFTLNQISPKFVPKASADNKSALVYVIMLVQISNEPLPKPTMNQFNNIIWHH